MADITMCLNSACPVKEKCYRFTAPQSHYQTVANFEFKYDNRVVSCDYFWLNSEDKKDQKYKKVYDGRGFKI